MSEGMILFDGFDDAIIGIAHRIGMDPIVAYDYDKCIEILMNDDMTEEDAHDHMGFNVEGSYVGERTPIFIRKHEGLDIMDVIKETE